MIRGRLLKGELRNLVYVGSVVVGLEWGGQDDE